MYPPPIRYIHIYAIGSQTKLYSVEVISKDQDSITVKLDGIPRQYANALRHICLNGVPTFAIDTVDVIENTTIFADEYLAHRLAFIPITTPNDRYKLPSEYDPQGEDDCPECEVMLVLDSGKTDQTSDVTSARLSSEDPDVRPVKDDIPIATLAPMQKVVMECRARLGRGSDHAKWNSANISVLTGNEEDGFELKVESTGARDPADIILAGIEELSRRLEEFGQAMKS